jgi:hypothetical protein
MQRSYFLTLLLICIGFLNQAIPNFQIPAAVLKVNAVERQQLSEFGSYVAECLPKYIQKIQITAGNELELLIAPEGIVPVCSFLKDHHTCQFTNIVDIAGMDVPARPNRFEVNKISGTYETILCRLKLLSSLLDNYLIDIGPSISGHLQLSLSPLQLKNPSQVIYG